MQPFFIGGGGQSVIDSTTGSVSGTLTWRVGPEWGSRGPSTQPGRGVGASVNVCASSSTRFAVSAQVAVGSSILMG